MSAPFLPENAPFSSAQRAWLNGFFAGMISRQGPAAPMMPNLAASAAPAPAPTPSEIEEDVPWHDPSLPIDERLKLAEGKNPERRLMAAMAQLDCGSCGYLCQSYAEAIAAGTETDLSRCTPGGRETAKWLKQIKSESPAIPITVKGSTPAPTTPSHSNPHDRNHPHPAVLLAQRKLNGPDSAKDTRLIILDLRESNLAYKPGDALGILPRNCLSTVNAILSHLNATGAEDVIAADGSRTSLRTALTEQRLITRPTESFFDLLAAIATDETEKAALHRLAAGDDPEREDWQVLDILEHFPSARPDPAEMVRTLSLLQPRLYSISSSLAAHPGQVHLTVGIVRYRNSAGRPCEGVASTFLVDRLSPGDAVNVFIHPSKSFSLPASPDTPIIMVGPGTGIAPFRAFLQERRATRAPGRNWLFFGDQKSTSDFLFKDEIESFLQAGLLTHLDLAFSRDQQEKVYVQDRMLQHAPEVFDWLQRGAHFYVCGDAKRMASDVDKALRKIVATAGNMTSEKADAYVSELVKTGRYHRDVY